MGRLPSRLLSPPFVLRLPFLVCLPFLLRLPLFLCLPQRCRRRRRELACALLRALLLEGLLPRRFHFSPPRLFLFLLSCRFRLPPVFLLLLLPSRFGSLTFLLQAFGFQALSFQTLGLKARSLKARGLDTRGLDTGGLDTRGLNTGSLPALLLLRFPALRCCRCLLARRFLLPLAFLFFLRTAARFFVLLPAFLFFLPASGFDSLSFLLEARGLQALSFLLFLLARRVRLAPAFFLLLLQPRFLFLLPTRFFFLLPTRFGGNPLPFETFRLDASFLLFPP